MLRAALAVKQDGIFLVGVEVRREDFPGGHLLAVGGGNRYLVHLAEFQLGEEFLVDFGDVFHLTAGYEADFLGTLHGVAHGDDVAVGELVNAAVVPVAGTFCEFVDFFIGKSYAEDGFDAVAIAVEDYRLAVGSPGEAFRPAVPAVGEVLGRCDVRRLGIDYHEAFLVALELGGLHGEPCYLGAVGREGGVGVVAVVALGDAGGLAACYVIEVEVRVGGEGIVFAGEFTRHVDKLLRVGTPCEGIGGSEGAHRAFEGLTLHDVLYVGKFGAVEVGQEGVGYFGDPLVPVLVHEVVDDAARSLGQSGIEGGVLVLFEDGGAEYHLFAVGGDYETFHTFFNRGNALSS